MHQLHFIYRHAKKVVIFVVGTTIALLGLAIGVLPGPNFALPLFFVGLAILATEYVWARRLLRRSKHLAERLADTAANAWPGPGPRCDDRNPSRLRRLIMRIRVPDDEAKREPQRRPTHPGLG